MKNEVTSKRMGKEKGNNNTTLHHFIVIDFVELKQWLKKNTIHNLVKRHYCLAILKWDRGSNK